MLSLPSVVACLAISGVGQTELIDFSAEWCGPCRQMQPIVDALAAGGHPVRKVDIDHDKALAARYGVTGIPCFVMLVDGQEVDRVVGGTTRARLEQMLQRAAKPAGQGGRTGISPGQNATFADEAPAPSSAPHPEIRGQSPDGVTPPTFAPEVAQPANGRLTPEVSRDPLIPSAPSVGQGPHRQALAEAGTALAEKSLATEKCLTSSVRLKIEDAGGNSVGSGTIIDARSGEALVLTCGHIFRESKGNGKIFIDLFGPGAPKRIPGQLVGYDLQRDVGLVTFRPGVTVVAAPLAAADYVVRSGDAVINVGCDNGREPTPRVSRVTSTDKYLPPPNIQVAGQPVEGRSGGGLFTADGVVIGVCNAADPADNEGLYAGIGSIHAELTRKGLSSMLATAAAETAPRMAPVMPATDRPNAGPRVVPTSADGPPGSLSAASAPAVLTPAERSLLDKAQAAGAEVICIVRPLANPHSMGEILVVDRASPALLQQLSAEGRSRATTARRPTSIVSNPAALTGQRREILDAAHSWLPNLGSQRFK